MDDIDFEKLKSQIHKQITTKNKKNIFWFENNMDSYVLLDENYYYCFDMYYLDKLYGGFVSSNKFNFMKNFCQAKEILFTYNKKIRKCDIWPILDNYLREKIKTNNRILVAIEQNSDEEELDKFLKYFAGKYFDVKK